MTTVTVPVKVNLPATVYRTLAKQAALTDTEDVGELLANLAQRALLGQLSWQKPPRARPLRGDEFIARFTQLYDAGIDTPQIARELRVTAATVTHYADTLRPNGPQS